MITFFTVGSHLLGPFISVLAGSSVDPEFRDHWPVNHFSSGKDGTTRFKLSAGFAGCFPKQLPSDRVSARCCISRHLPDIIRHRESIPVPLCRRRGIDRGRRVFQSFLESDESIWLTQLDSRWSRAQDLGTCFSRPRSWDPAGPTFHALLRLHVPLLDFDNHREMVPGTKSYLAQVPCRRVNILRLHNVIELFLANPRVTLEVIIIVLPGTLSLYS